MSMNVAIAAIAATATATAIVVRAWVVRASRRYMPPEPAALRTDLEFWYYGIQPGEHDAVAGHVTMIHESGWYVDAQGIATSMRSHGMRTMLTVQEALWDGNRVHDDAAGRLHALFDTLRDAGVLHQVVALYVIDEPDGRNCSHEDVVRACVLLRQVALDYPALAGVKLAVTYSYKGTLPGIDALDWVGLDDYGLGSGVLVSKQWRQMMSRLRMDQRCFVVPGGADPWRQDPEAFRRYAHSTPQCVGIMPFMWGSRDDSGEKNAGIKSNGMAPVYEALGHGILALRGKA